MVYVAPQATHIGVLDAALHELASTLATEAPWWGEGDGELALRTRFDTVCRALNLTLGPSSRFDSHTRATIRACVRRALHPTVLETRVGRRMLEKPRGYAGDYLTIAWMYENRAGGSTPAGQRLDRLFLDRPSAKAVRNRRLLLAEFLAEAAGGPITSLACGPGRELEDAGVGEHVTAVDLDADALGWVQDRVPGVRTVRANLAHLATERTTLELGPQRLIYSIGLVDYFPDQLVVGLLDWVHGQLEPGGRVVLGNFHPRNPDRGFMDHVLDWALFHRSAEDMDRLFQASRFGRRCDEIVYEREGVNLFAVGVRR